MLGSRVEKLILFPGGEILLVLLGQLSERWKQCLRVPPTNPNLLHNGSTLAPLGPSSAVSRLADLTPPFPVCTSPILWHFPPFEHVAYPKSMCFAKVACPGYPYLLTNSTPHSTSFKRDSTTCTTYFPSYSIWIVLRDFPSKHHSPKHCGWRLCTFYSIPGWFCLLNQSNIPVPPRFRLQPLWSKDCFWICFCTVPRTIRPSWGPEVLP